MYHEQLNRVAFTISTDIKLGHVTGSGSFAGYIESIGNRRVLTLLIVGILVRRLKEEEW